MTCTEFKVGDRVEANVRGLFLYGWDDRGWEKGTIVGVQWAEQLQINFYVVQLDTGALLSLVSNALKLLGDW